MTKSMTGYGLAQTENQTHSIQAELKTLNSKFLDLSLRLPKELSAFEYQIRDLLSKGLVRGKASFSMEMTLKEGVKSSVYNAIAFEELFAELKAVAKDKNVNESDVFNSVMKMPEVLQQSGKTIDVSDHSFVLNLVKEAIKKCNDFRTQEGDSLEKALLESISAIDTKMQEIKELEPMRAETIRARLSGNIQEIIDADKIDENRFEQELIYYLEKLDISEELVRLSNHLVYFNETLASPESQGKKLGFIGQEIGREINTIGSKANNASIQRLVVEMKDELEKIKEQVLNIL